MSKSLTIAAIIFPTLALAQPSVTLTFSTTQECGVPEVIFQESFEYGEQPLWGGETLVFGSDQQAYWGTAFFTVNQETGFWTLYTFYGDDLVCVTASGVGFVPTM